MSAIQTGSAVSYNILGAAMMAACQAAGRPVVEKSAPQKSGMQKKAKASQGGVSTKPATQQAVTPKDLVTLKRDQLVTVVFESTRDYIPNGIQVIPQSGGAAAAKSSNAQPSDDLCLSMVKFDLDGFIRRVSVESINVIASGDYCRTYINCKTAVGDEAGFGAWAGPYEKFVRAALSHRFGKVIVRERDGKVSIVLRKSDREQAQKKIRFALEQ